MAKKIGALFATLTMKSNRFEAGLSKAAKRLRDFRVSFASVSKKLAGLTAALTVTAVTGFAALVRSQFQAVDKLAKTATKLGVTTEGLSRLRYAGQLTGVEISKLDLGVQRFTRRLAEAAHGSGEAKAVIAALGIDAAALNKLPLDRQMLKLADAFDKLGKGGDRILAGFKLFDSEGVDLIRTLTGGSKALRKMFDESDRFGATVDSWDARKVELIQDQFTRIADTLDAIGRSLSVAVIPLIDAFATRVLGITVNFQYFGEYLLEIARNTGGLVKAMFLFKGGVDASTQSLKNFWDEMFRGFSAERDQAADRSAAQLRETMQGFSAIWNMDLAQSIDKSIEDFEYKMRELAAQQAQAGAALNLGPFTRTIPRTGAGAGPILRGTHEDFLARFRHHAFGAQAVRMRQIAIQNHRNIRTIAANTKALARIKSQRIP